MIPYGRQEITEGDIAEVEKVLRSEYLTQGPLVPKFEQSVASYSGASHAVAVNSGYERIASRLPCFGARSWRLVMDLT